MTWLQRYRIRHFLSNSIWAYPVLSVLAALGLVRLLHKIEVDMNWVSTVDPDTARAVLGTMASALFTAIVFVCTALLVAVQLASAALTPRIIALVFRDPVSKFSLTLLVFCFAFSLSALVRIGHQVPLLTVYGSAYASLISLGVFLYLIDHVGKALRPSGALRGVALLGSRVVDSCYPHSLNGPHDGKKLDAAPLPGAQPAKIVLSLSDGVVLAFDPKGLLSLAEEVDCTIEMVPQVGDHVSVGDPLFRIYGGGRDFSAEVLQHSVAKGQERTLEQDPTFALRIIVDVASKALSPAINDPTTAVLALDQIHKLLRQVGNRNLDIGQVRDSAGRLRLVYHTPDWEDFVYLAVTEIRLFGGASIQIARRLRAMLENLILTLPDARSALLRQELTMLQRSSERLFAEPEDRALAGISDFQGVGGNRE